VTRGNRTDIAVVAGARPNFMKVAPVLRALRERSGFAPFLIHTGQHYDQAMSDSFFRDLGLPEPDINLGVGSGRHGEQTAEVLCKIEALFIDRRPAIVLVVGDVNSTLAAAIAASKLGIGIAHVEAGLRSFDRSMPEEINRVLTDAISDWCFTTEPVAKENLLREGVSQDRIHFVGNVMIDSLLANLERARATNACARLGLAPGQFAVLTLHRPANVDDPTTLSRLFGALEELHRDVPVVFPIHPRTRASIERLLGGAPPRLQIVDPLGYLDFLGLMADARLVLTDSGGIQEETTVLGIPCLTLRDNTERPITITQGTNRLVGRDPERIRAGVAEVLSQAPVAPRLPEGWDGKAAARIVDVLERTQE